MTVVEPAAPATSALAMAIVAVTTMTVAAAVVLAALAAAGLKALKMAIVEVTTTTASSSMTMALCGGLRGGLQKRKTTENLIIGRATTRIRERYGRYFPCSRLLGDDTYRKTVASEWTGQILQQALCTGRRNVLLVVGRPGRIVYMVLITTTRAQRRRFRNALLRFVMRCCRDCDWGPAGGIGLACTVSDPRVCWPLFVVRFAPLINGVGIRRRASRS